MAVKKNYYYAIQSKRFKFSYLKAKFLITEVRSRLSLGKKTLVFCTKSLCVSYWNDMCCVDHMKQYVNLVLHKARREIVQIDQTRKKREKTHILNRTKKMYYIVIDYTQTFACPVKEKVWYVRVIYIAVCYVVNIRQVWCICPSH